MSNVSFVPHLYFQALTNEPLFYLVILHGAMVILQDEEQMLNNSVDWQKQF